MVISGLLGGVGLNVMGCLRMSECFSKAGCFDVKYLLDEASSSLSSETDFSRTAGSLKKISSTNQ